MPPKAKEVTKKAPPPIIRPAISDSSFLYIPDDAIEGYQDRIETEIDWTLIEAAARYHKTLCSSEELPKITFSEALLTKINNSILNGFLYDNSGLSLDQHWELLLPITLWDNEKCANEEGKICFNNVNCITDDMMKLIKKCVRTGDRKALKKDLKMVHVLRVNDCRMTDLDEGLSEYHKLVSLNLCGNFIAELDASFIPPGLRTLELQANRIRDVEGFAEHLPVDLLYLGLARNLFSNDSIEGLGRLPHNLTVLDLSDNDIYHLEPLLEILARLPSLTSLYLAGNPCAICAGYARTTLARLPRLKWLDSREVISSDRSFEPFEPHPDDLRATYFNFNIIRVISAPPPPKTEKGATSLFHVELELPLLDLNRRRFLMFRNYESLVEMLPVPEDDSEGLASKYNSANLESKTFGTLGEHEESNHEFDIYAHLTVKNSRQIFHYTTFESNKVPWNKIMTFQDPVIRIFCPDLIALRNTFRSTVTIRLVYTMTYTAIKAKPEKKSMLTIKPPPTEQRVVLATVKCALCQPDWSQPFQHFHWDDSLGTDDAIHWGDGDLTAVQYTQTVAKPTKGKPDSEPMYAKQLFPDNLTCHFSFSIETLRII